MTIEEIIGIADEAYPDGKVGAYFREPKRKHGDTLAEFVARELESTYAPCGPKRKQLAVASRAMKVAIRELQDVVHALNGARAGGGKRKQEEYAL